MIQDVKQAMFLVIVLVGKPLKANGSGDIISIELKLMFCSCSVVSVLLKNYFKLSNFFCTFDIRFQLSLYDYVHDFVAVYFL